jgi:hypothetical protein
MSILRRKIRVDTTTTTQQPGPNHWVTVSSLHPTMGHIQTTKILTKDEALELAALLTETANSLPSESES